MRAVHRRVLRLSSGLMIGLAVTACSTSDGQWPAPDPERPVVKVRYDVAAGHEVVQGWEEITFVPDREICEIVLRAWPNKPVTARSGNSLVVQTVRVDGERRRHQTVSGGAPDGAPGTLIEVPLDRCRAAGSRVHVEVDFSVRLADGTDERMGRDARRGIAWLGTAYPLLAWQRDVGWVRDDAVPIVGEMSTSETFDLAELRVSVPVGERVAGVGEADGVTSTGERSTFSFSAPAMRDIAVTVGNIDIHHTQAAATRLHLVVPRGTAQERVAEWQSMIGAILGDLSSVLGPVPYADLWISLLPAVSDGVELSGAIQLTTLRATDDWLVAHELAHQWFYGLVGNNQALHPWLDESLATYSQELVRPVRWEDPEHVRDRELGAPLTHWASLPDGSRAYVDTVYLYGGHILTDQRAVVGEDLDNALRSYLRAQAHRVAAPADLRAELADLPAVVDALAEAGAWETGARSSPTSP